MATCAAFADVFDDCDQPIVELVFAGVAIGGEVEEWFDLHVGLDLMAPFIEEFELERHNFWCVVEDLVAGFWTGSIATSITTVFFQILRHVILQVLGQGATRNAGFEVVLRVLLQEWHG